ncbi:hypothetical protein AB0J90_16895 [Micromonospora sp. NPDC049523]|uniref:hypothetical protein n=1 Tax=Micromonospora sp. NPDC049523 TaxID=3155921 RepID=UPI00342CD330
MTRVPAFERSTGTAVCGSHRRSSAAYAGQWVAGYVQLGPGPTRAECDGAVVSAGGGDADPTVGGHAVPPNFSAAVRNVTVATTTGPFHRPVTEREVYAP